MSFVGGGGSSVIVIVVVIGKVSTRNVNSKEKRRFYIEISPRLVRPLTVVRQSDVSHLRILFLVRVNKSIVSRSHCVTVVKKKK